MKTHKQNVLEKYDLPDVGYSVKELSKITGISSKILQEVYNRGIGAWKSSAVGIRRISDGKKDYTTSRAGKMSKEAWASARVYSFLDKGKTFMTADSDLAKMI
jgi:hypothetical protein